MSDSLDVREFMSATLGLELPSAPCLLPRDDWDFRARLLHEEVGEYRSAMEDGDLAEAVDALVDLAYVAHGTMLLHGVRWRAVWDEVHSANMRKVRGDKGRGGGGMDAVKPDGWKAPDHSRAVGAPPWVARRITARRVA